MATVTNHSRYLSSSLDPARQSYPVMPKRTLGNTGLSVGAIGVGTSALGGGFAAVPDEEAIYSLGLALDMQASLVDLACPDGENRAAGLLAAAMRQRRRQACVCLRVAGGPEEMRRKTEAALGALGTDHADILLWDQPGPRELTGRESVWAALASLKKEGKVLCVGASVAPDEVRAAVEQTPAEVLRVPLNVFEQEAVEALDLAAAKGLGVIAARPLAGGWLSGRFGAGQLFVDARRRWSRFDKVRRAQLQQAFESLASTPGTTSAQAALQFVLGFPQVSCAVPSISDWHQVVGNVDAARGSLDPAVASALRDLWARELRSDPLVP